MAFETERGAEFSKKHTVVGTVGIMAEKTVPPRNRSVGNLFFRFVPMARHTECRTSFQRCNGTLVGGVLPAGNRLVAGKTIRLSHRSVNNLVLFVPQQVGVALEAAGLLR